MQQQVNPTPDPQVAELRRVLAVFENNAGAIIRLAHIALEKTGRGR